MEWAGMHWDGAIQLGDLIVAAVGLILLPAGKKIGRAHV